ncbi:MAG: DUF192 domain-containing protein [Coriobacteriia bacterium]|nr:DUF192 domain-containing protein [Coriobacteriia bacterium]
MDQQHNENCQTVVEVRVAQPLHIAATPQARARGLFDPRHKWGVVALVPCRDIHTFGMRCALDVAFVDSMGTVLQVIRGLPP